MSKSLHIGDLHLGHRAIHHHRKLFSSATEHDEFLVDQICKTCNKRDTLWLHGDLFFDDDERIRGYVQRLLDCVMRMNVIIGNHETDRTRRVDILQSVMNRPKVNFHSLVNRKGCWYSHHPIHPNELYGKINVHGHVHYNTIEEPGYFNVSAENIGFIPRSIEEIKDAHVDNDWYRFRNENIVKMNLDIWRKYNGYDAHHTS